MTHRMNSKQIADDLAANLATDSKTDTLVAAVIAACYRVNSNVASAALRRLEKAGLVEKDGHSVAGNLIYRVRRVTVVTPPPASPVFVRSAVSA